MIKPANNWPQNATGVNPEHAPDILGQETVLKLTIGLAVLATIVGGCWAVSPTALHRDNSPTPEVEAPPAQSFSATTIPSVGLESAAMPTAAAIPATESSVQNLLRTFDQSFAESAATLDTKHLQADRQAAAQALVDKLSALGPGGARSIAKAFKTNNNFRDRTCLAQALGWIHDRETVSMIKELLASQTDSYTRQQLVIALGHRTEPSVIEPLARMLTADKPDFVQFAAVQALAGRPAALPVLQAAIQSSFKSTVRLEAIRGVGLIGTDAAKTTLTDLAQEPAVEPFIRESAAQELRRSFGSAVVGTLESLGQDPEPAVHESASRALTMQHAKH